MRNGLDGIDFLRYAVRMLDSRNEALNENKTPVQLLNEVMKAVRPGSEFNFYTGSDYNENE